MMTKYHLAVPFYGLLGIVVTGALLGSCSGRDQSAAPSTETPAAVELLSDGRASSTVASDEKSIAVLPFSDLSELGDQEYFSDGLTETLIERLAELPELEVTSREESFRYKNRDEVLSSIGDTLGVNYILLGSIRKSNEHLRVSAQLVDASDDFNLWSRSYDRELADVFEIEDEIAEAVLTALSVSLGAGEFNRAGSTRNVHAYDTALRAFATYSEFTPDAIFRALGLAEEAVRLDPDYGRAWMLLGAIYTESPLILSAEQSAGFGEQASQAFAKAREAGPDMPELLLVDAVGQRNTNNFIEAEKLYLQYFEQYGYGFHRANEEYAQQLARTGRVAEALAYHQKASQLEPLSPRYTYNYVQRLLSLGRIEEALDELESLLTLNPTNWSFHSLGWKAAAMKGDFSKAAELINSFYASESVKQGATVSESFMREFADILLINDFDSSIQAISDLIERQAVTPYEMISIARLVAILGQPDLALNFWQDRTILPSIWDPYYSDMRALPEFRNLMEDSGLADFWRSTGKWGDFCKPLPDSDTDFECF